jgi:aldose 1-epimerase
MTSGNTKSPYSAAAIPDRDLNTTIIALSYTDPSNPAHSLLACIAPDLGSNFYRFKVGGHELFHYEQEKLKERGHTGNFVLWPFPNRVRDRQYTYRERQYSLASVKRSPGSGSLIHGLVYDRSWIYEQPSVSSEGAAVTTSVEINPDSPNYSAYPFLSRLALTYTLTSSGLIVTYSVQNKGSQALPYGFALHPYLNLLPDREQTLVTLPAAQVMEADQELLPTGRLLDIHSPMYQMFDLSQSMPVHQLKLDHVYTGLPRPSEACIDYPGMNLRLYISASDDFTHTVVYTPTQSSFFCLENQTCSTDAINLAHRGMQDIAHLLEVQPGEIASGFIRYEVAHTTS